MDRLMLGLSTTAIGILVVFFGLVILIGCIYVMTLFTARKNRKAEAAPRPAPVPVPVPDPAAEEAPEEDDGALIAVISAAIAAVWQNENTGFVVRRVRRIQNSTARSRAARDEQIFSHL